MEFIIHCIGRSKDKEMQKLINEYVKRLNNQIYFDEIPSVESGEINKIKKIETESLLNRAKTGYKICLDERGKCLNSLEFSNIISNALNHNSKIHFFIGGAHGHDPIIYDKCDKTIALSLLTFPHQMVRLIITEQIYRAISIMKQHPYHKV